MAPLSEKEQWINPEKRLFRNKNRNYIYGVCVNQILFILFGLVFLDSICCLDIQRSLAYKKLLF